MIINNSPTPDSALLSSGARSAGCSMLAPVAVHMFSGAQLGGKQQLSDITKPVIPPLNKNTPKSKNIARIVNGIFSCIFLSLFC